MTIAMDVVIEKLHDLPSLPAIVMEIMQSIGQSDVDIKTLADKVQRDQALSAKTLRLANSSFYGMQRKVTTIQQAISILGFHSVRTLVTAAAVTGSFQAVKFRDFNFHAFWRHAIASAVCAKVLARHCQANQEYAFMAGLLHDIGRLALVTAFPLEYAAVIAHRATEDCYLFNAERAILGVDHAYAGLVLAERWKFPDIMQKAVGNHHDLINQPHDSLAAIVHVADAIVHALDLSDQEDDLVPPLSGIAWDSLHINQQDFLQICRDTDLQFEEASHILTA